MTAGTHQSGARESRRSHQPRLLVPSKPNPSIIPQTSLPSALASISEAVLISFKKEFECYHLPPPSPLERVGVRQLRCSGFPNPLFGISKSRTQEQKICNPLFGISKSRTQEQKICNPLFGISKSRTQEQKICNLIILNPQGFFLTLRVSHPPKPPIISLPFPKFQNFGKVTTTFPAILSP
jgi:hypothetical protein